MRLISLLLVLSACTTVPLHRTMLGGELVEAGKRVGAIEPSGSCPTGLRVHVRDLHFKPVAGARVVESQRVAEHCAEETLSVYELSTSAVTTDEQGTAWVCNPNELLQ